MQFFTLDEFRVKHSEFATIQIPTWQIEAASEMIFSQVGLRRRDASWDTQSVPLIIKNASMEQLRYMLEHDLPFIDSNKIKAGSMEAEIFSDYSTLALRMLANGGYLYRGSQMNANMSLDIPFGG